MEMKRKIEGAIVMGVFLFLETTSGAAFEGKPLMHPVIGNVVGQPSRALYRNPPDQGVAQRPGMSRGKEGVITKMNRLMFQDTIQRLTAPNAFRAQRPVVSELPNPNRVERGRP